MKNIFELFLRKAEDRPHHPAIIEKNKQISFGELQEEVVKTAAYFNSKGIEKGDRVLVFVPMSIALYRIVLALFYIGATAVFIDEWADRQRLKTCCEMADCKGFIGTWKARIYAMFTQSLRKIPVKLRKSKTIDGSPLVCKMKKEEAALITFTTGSSGTPKAALRTHGFLKEQFDALSEEIQPDLSDIDMPSLPIVLLINLGQGCTSVIPNFNMRKAASLKPRKLIRQIQQQSVSRITASPFLVRKIATYSIQYELQLPTLQKIFTGGGAVFPTEANQYLNAFPQSEITILYGSTEAEPISSISARELASREEELDKGLLVGLPFHKCRVRIIPISSQAITCNSREEFEGLLLGEEKTGEIIVTGPHVLHQYFKNEDAFEKNKIIVGETIWHRTGDGGYLKNKELFLTGRIDRMIPTENGWLSPFIIENQLQKIKGVRAGTLLKHGDTLYLLLESAQSGKKLREHIPKIPYDQLLIVEELPRDPRHHAKIDYGALVEFIENK